MLRLILAASRDGFLARGPKDDMAWTPRADKLAFRLLTSVDGVCAVGSRTFDQMPSLSGRRLIRLSREPQEGSMTLGRYIERYPNGWLLGGPTVAMEALTIGAVGQVFMCRNAVCLTDGVPDTVTPYLRGDRGGERGRGKPWSFSRVAAFDGVEVERWAV